MSFRPQPEPTPFLPADCVTARRNEARCIGAGESRGDYALACFIFRILRRPQIEVTETSPLYDSQIAAKNMTELKAIGVKLALDDFGTGHANLNYLLKYPFDTLKIDKEFVTAIEPDTRSTKIVEGIISLAHNFGIEVLAEGVETQSQLDRLMQIGCDKIQGFFISPPVQAQEIPSLLAQYNR